jgi:hypothetical protein
MIRWRWVWNSQWSENRDGKPKYSWENLPQCHFVNHATGDTWDRTGFAAVGSRRLTVWAMARPLIFTFSMYTIVLIHDFFFFVKYVLSEMLSFFCMHECTRPVSSEDNVLRVHIWEKVLAVWPWSAVGHADVGATSEHLRFNLYTCKTQQWTRKRELDCYFVSSPRIGLMVVTTDRWHLQQFFLITEFMVGFTAF